MSEPKPLPDLVHLIPRPSKDVSDLAAYQDSYRDQFVQFDAYRDPPAHLSVEAFERIARLSRGGADE